MFLQEIMSYSMSIPWAGSDQLSQLCPLPPSCPSRAYLLGAAEWGERQPQCCSCAVLQEPKHCSAISTGLATNPQRGTIQAAVENGSSIPATSSTGILFCRTVFYLPSSRPSTRPSRLRICLAVGKENGEHCVCEAVSL